MPGKESKEERTFNGFDYATPDPHLRSDYTLTGMRAACCTSDWKRGDVQGANQANLRAAQNLNRAIRSRAGAIPIQVR